MQRSCDVCVDAVRTFWKWIRRALMENLVRRVCCTHEITLLRTSTLTLYGGVLVWLFTKLIVYGKPWQVALAVHVTHLIEYRQIYRSLHFQKHLQKPPGRSLKDFTDE